MNFSPLTRYQKREILRPVRKMKVSPPPQPWRGPIHSAIGGATMVGFDGVGKLLVLSDSGIGVVDPATGRTIRRDRDVNADQVLSLETLTYRVSSASEPVPVFGLYGGEGLRGTRDGWSTETVYPWWPYARVLLKRPLVTGVKFAPYVGATLIHDNDAVRMHTGFSPDGRNLVIFESHSITFFSRP